MASSTNISDVATANTFDEWRIQTNLIGDDANEIARGDFIKPAGNVTISDGYLLLDKGSGITLEVDADARVSGLLDLKNLEQDADGYLYSEAGDIQFQNAEVIIQVAGNTHTRFLFNNTYSSLANVNANGYIETTGVHSNNDLFMNIANVLKVNTTGTVNISASATSQGNLNVANLHVETHADIVSAFVGSLEVDTLTTNSPIQGEAEIAAGTYRLRVGALTDGDGSFGVWRGSSTKGNAWIEFSSGDEVWKVTNSDMGLDGLGGNPATYYTILTTANLTNDLANTSQYAIPSAFLANSIYETLSSTNEAADAAANTTSVSANSGSVLYKRVVNFVNTEQVIVSVAESTQPGFQGTVANVSFTVTEAVGRQGSPGVQGAQGVQGDRGIQGAQGLQGAQGVQGLIGRQGDRGIQGAQGLQGAQGVQGLIGRQGEKGDVGIQGVQGLAGTYGVRGGVEYKMDTTVNGTPASGEITFSSSTASSISIIKIHETDRRGVDQSAFIGAWDDNSAPVSGIRGYLTIQSRDPTSSDFIAFRITGAITDSGTYRQVPVSYVSGSIPGNNNELAVNFSATGDVGAQGANGADGSQGPAGVQGRQGTQGPQGRQGLKGDKGDTGDAGAVGVQGRQGTQGPQGSAGPSNVLNASSTTGAQYLVGSPGTGNQTPYISSVYMSGNQVYAVDFNATSDAKFKDVIGAIEDPVIKVNALEGIEYTWNALAKEQGLSEADDASVQIGLIAQEVEKVYPSLVTELNGNKAVRYSKVVALLIEAVKELNARVKKLEEKLGE